METAGNQAFEEETEKKGLGTPATRASIIEKLVSSGYAERKGKQIAATKDGADLISVLPEYLRSAAMTVQWENRLLLMEKGELESSEFLDGIVELIDRMLLECGELSVEDQNRFYPREKIGVCPVCGSPVYESKRNFFCGNRDCAFALWKENRYLSGMRKSAGQKDGCGTFERRTDVCAGSVFPEEKAEPLRHTCAWTRKMGEPASVWNFRKKKT